MREKLTPRERKLKKRRLALFNKKVAVIRTRKKALTLRERRLKRKINKLLNERVRVIKKRFKSKKAKLRIENRVDHIKRRTR